MKFEEMMPMDSDMTIYSAKVGLYTFVITKQEGGFTASAKIIGAQSRIDLGGYLAHKTFNEAKSACEDFLSGKSKS